MSAVVDCVRPVKHGILAAHIRRLEKARRPWFKKPWVHKQLFWLLEVGHRGTEPLWLTHVPEAPNNQRNKVSRTSSAFDPFITHLLALWHWNQYTWEVRCKRTEELNPEGLGLKGGMKEDCNGGRWLAGSNSYLSAVSGEGLHGYLQPVFKYIQ